jgi:hypothetical protein
MYVVSFDRLGPTTHTCGKQLYMYLYARPKVEVAHSSTEQLRDSDAYSMQVLHHGLPVGRWWVTSVSSCIDPNSDVKRRKSIEECLQNRRG